MPRIKDVYVKNMYQKRILENRNGVVRVSKDLETGTYSIGIQTRIDTAFKFISKELHDLLLKELVNVPNYNGDMVNSPIYRASVELDYEEKKEKQEEIEKMENELGISKETIQVPPNIEKDFEVYGDYEKWYEEELKRRYSMNER